MKSAIAASVMLEVSIFVLFVDLVKAFDKVIRQIVYGWGDGKPDDPKAFLESMGVAGSAASWICDYIDEKGHLLNQWGADEKANQLACTLHHGAWFSVGYLPSVITSQTGGRQGCTLGMTTFNSAYTVGLDLLAWGLKKHDIAMVVQVPTSAFWSEPDPANAERDDVIHATFVDGECTVLLANSPKVLDKAIDVLLSVLAPTFGNMHLTINWKPGKTEALPRTRCSAENREGRRTAS